MKNQLKPLLLGLVAVVIMLLVVKCSNPAEENAGPTSRTPYSVVQTI